MGEGSRAAHRHRVQVVPAARTAPLGPQQTCGNCPADCGPCQPSADFFQCVEPNKYALTFDDGPSEFSNALLDILAINKVQVSYFLVGQQIEAFKAQINREVSKGARRPDPALP